MRTLFILIAAFCLISFSSCATHVTTRPAKVTIVKTAPKNHRIVKVKGRQYYFWNGRHYKKTRRGYIFVKV